MEKQLLAQEMNIKRYLIRFPQEEVLKAENEIVARLTSTTLLRDLERERHPRHL